MKVNIFVNDFMSMLKHYVMFLTFLKKYLMSNELTRAKYPHIELKRYRNGRDKRKY